MMYVPVQKPIGVRLKSQWFSLSSWPEDCHPSSTVRQDVFPLIQLFYSIQALDRTG